MTAPDGGYNSKHGLKRRCDRKMVTFIGFDVIEVIVSVTDRDFENPDWNRLIRDPDRDGSSGWGDQCSSCGHSRADHIILNPTTGSPVSVVAVNSFSDCNILCKDGDKAKGKPAEISECDCSRFTHGG